jgi:hypothetical protein
MKKLAAHGLFIALSLLFCSVPFFTYAQTVPYTALKDSKVSVDGTSTLSDWSAKVGETEGNLVLQPDFLKKTLRTGDGIVSVDLKFKVSTMDGGRGTTMNDKIYKALKETEHPYITFRNTTPVKIVSVKDARAGTFVIDARGDLSMGGVTKPVDIRLDAEKMPNGQLRFTGKKALAMTDFQIDPPSAMFGQIVTGDAITINFELVFDKATGVGL